MSDVYEIPKGTRWKKPLKRTTKARLVPDTPVAAEDITAGEVAPTASPKPPTTPSTPIEPRRGVVAAGLGLPPVDAGQLAIEPPEPTPAESEAMQEAQFGGDNPDAYPFIADEDLIGGLPNDAPGDDRIDNALIERVKEQERATAFEWLMGGAGAVAKEVGGGLAELPSQVVGGARDAAQAAFNLIDYLGDTLAQGAAAVGLESQERADQLSAETNMPQLPEVREATTTTGGLIRGVSQFLTGYAAAGGMTGLGTGVGAAAAKGAVADFAFFDGQDVALSNLIQSHPGLANPVTEFLATDPNDNEGWNRFRRVVEGLGIGAATQAFSWAVKSVRDYRAKPSSPSAAATNGASIARTAEPEFMPARDLLLLGSPDAPLTVRDGSRAAQKILSAADETVTGVPGQVAAKSLTDKGLTPLSEAGDVFVNFARIEGPDDIKRVIKDVASALKENVDEARRGVRTHAQTKAAAGGLDAFDIVMERRVGDALNAEQSLAVRHLWTGAADKLQQVAKAAAENPSTENLFQFRKMMATFHAIQKEALGARAETARALNSWKIPAGGSRQQMAALEAALTNHGGLEVNLDMARRVAGFTDMAALGKFAEKGVYAKTRDSVQEFWINAILSGPQTHIVNMISNASVAGLNIAEHAVAARLGRLIGGKDVVEVGEALAQSHGVIASFRDALRNAAKSFMTGETGYGINKIEGPRTRSISSTEWSLRSKSNFGKAVDAFGAVVNSVGRGLGAEDEFFKTIGYRMSLHSQAYRQVQKEIGEGILSKARIKERLAELVANPTEGMSLEAAAQAAYQTFTTEPGPIISKLNAIRGKAPLLKFVLPFVNTPTNIFKFTAERTPLAPLTARFRTAIAKGGAEADLAITKMALGSMTMLTGLDLALNGSLTGTGPKSPAERAALERTGWKPNSVKIGDKYFAYNRLDPLGAQLGMAAELGEYLANSGEMDEEDDSNFTRAMSAAIFSIAETTTSKTYMKGFSDLVEAVNDPDRYAMGYVKRFVSGFIPNIVKAVTRGMDPVPRYTVGLIDELKSKLPGYSDDLPPRRDLWGREVRYESGIGKAYDVLSPIYGSTYKPEPIDLEMTKGGWFIGMPGKSFSHEGIPIRLTNRPDAYSRLTELSGGTKPSDMGTAGEALIAKYGDYTLLEALNFIVSTGAPDRGATVPAGGTIAERAQNAFDIPPSIDDPTAPSRDELNRIFAKAERGEQIGPRDTMALAWMQAHGLNPGDPATARFLKAAPPILKLANEYQALTDEEEKETFVRRISTRYRKAAKELLVVEFPDLLRAE